MKNILKLKPWSLVEVLTTKYDWEGRTAQGFAEFRLPMLEYEPISRATAAQCLVSPYLQRLSTTADLTWRLLEIHFSYLCISIKNSKGRTVVNQPGTGAKRCNVVQVCRIQRRARSQICNFIRLNFLNQFTTFLFEMSDRCYILYLVSYPWHKWDLLPELIIALRTLWCWPTLHHQCSVMIKAAAWKPDMIGREWVSGQTWEDPLLQRELNLTRGNSPASSADPDLRANFASSTAAGGAIPLSDYRKGKWAGWSDTKLIAWSSNHQFLQ